MSREITPLHIMSAFQVEPPALDFIISGFLSGTVGALYSPGGVGKSFLALEIAASVAGVDLLGFGPHCTGRTLYIALEDPEIVLRRRLFAIGSHLSLQQREIFAEKVEVLPMLGVPFDLRDGRHANWLTARADGVRLIIADTLSRAHSGDESSNGEMAQLLRVLERIGANTGASVLFLHHVNKSSGRDRNGDQFSIRGASALLDNARFGAAITYLEHDDAAAGTRIRYSVSKNNYAAPIPHRYFLRHEGGVLLPASQEHDDETGESPKEQRMGQRLNHHKPKALSSLLNPCGSPYLAAKNGETHDW
ncbi:helicase RepA family protein [Acidithiobacillus sulfuriphilus]|uniref:Replication protein A n=2 Tax=Acidithiobacillus sulfuriphilus TaxID=1867749 RepID=A0A3M8S040_9PROT|nr:helicase RepA family protein [Acidithiobacillus sulfuriphilus]RNF72680.1 replication protein A [Acidithiobacillus sulfuriphilus]